MLRSGSGKSWFANEVGSSFCEKLRFASGRLWFANGIIVSCERYMVVVNINCFFPFAASIVTSCMTFTCLRVILQNRKLSKREINEHMEVFGKIPV